MKKVIVMVLSLICLLSLSAQWSGQASNPDMIAGGFGEQVIPKVGICSDGSIYISRFDNSSGNYDVWLQKLSPTGHQVWGDQGVLVSNHQAMSWLTDYDMDVDPENNAVITFQDIRNGVNNVYAYKVDPQGVSLWTINGITLSSDTNTDYSNMSPKVLCTSDGSSYVAWARTGDVPIVRINRLNAMGDKVWGEEGVVIESAAGSVSWPQLLETTGGVLVKYFIDSGPFWAPNRHVYLAKYDLNGQRVWNTPVSTAAGISAWTQIFSFQSDGMDGAIIAWHDDRNNDMVNEVYIQRVNATGQITMPQNGAMISTDTANQQYYPKIAVDTVNQRIYAIYKQTNSAQTQDGLNRQLLDFEGNRLWGDMGVAMIGLSSFVASPIDVYHTGRGAIMIYEEGVVPNSDQSMHIRAVCLNQDGMNLWDGQVLDVATTNSAKVHPDMAVHPENWCVLAWEEGLSSNEIYGMRLNANGSIGMHYPPPQNLTSTLLGSGTIHLQWEFAYPSYMPLTWSVYMNGMLAEVVNSDLLEHSFPDLAPGNYQFYIIANYAGNYNSEASETHHVTIVSIPNDSNASPPVSVMLYPNPVRDQATLRYFAKQQSLVRIYIYNLKGQLVAKQDLPTGESGWNEFSIDLSTPMLNHLGSGIYLLRIVNSYQSLQVKMILIK